ncbi:sulfatase [Roseiconus nitratireducens]|uniref:Sulfatase n=1 Tax=Roseiconus nitratireducens TaxID=2605748 RepID=A0A5M6DDL4_9BACT|nr:sulfatase [Roseiconus nitratireducens]KAA5544372.1 sulfatase [Roseiconus nitratireducens]
MIRSLVVAGICLVGWLLFAVEGRTEETRRPNVLMICIDDLNDWVEPLGGHPQVQTPAMASLAQRGVVFTNAHCQSPLCNPSRTSLMLSLRPSTTGIYGLAPWFRRLDERRSTVSLPQHFKAAGYETYSGGKVYHGQHKNPGPGQQPEFDHWGPAGGTGVRPPQKLVPPTPAGNNPLVDWGVFDHEDSQKGDWIVADWATKTLREIPAEQPFFLSCGFFLPHVPCHVTQKWWDLYPDETLEMPTILEGDRDDCPPFSWFLHWRLPEPRITWLREKNEHRNLVRAYLASISFVDSQVQRVLDALAESPHADNTIICLWSDHGWHLGEKAISGKNTLWERSTRVPLIFAGPGIRPGRCEQPAELLDVYPTLAQLAGLPEPAAVEGVSLVPQIENTDTPRDRPAMTEHNPGNLGIRDVRYRFIRYADGSEELYDLRQDPHEHHNLISDVAHAAAADRLRAFIPPSIAPLAPGSAARILEKREDGWYWEGEKIDTDHPPMYTGNSFKKQAAEQ